jgi:hypothetical protein
MPSSSQVHLCVSCRSNLARGDPDATFPPPPLAICNNWAVCPLPPIIRDMNPTWAEFSVRARAQVAIRYVVNGRGRFQMLSHNMVFLNQKPAANSLPREFTSDEYFVVFAKLNDDDLAVQQKNRLLVRKAVTDALGDHYRRNIPQYSDIPEDDKFFGESGERLLDDLCHNDGADSTLISDAQDSSVRPGHVRLLHDVGVSTSTAFLGESASPTFQVTRSSDLMNHHHKDYDAAVFPALHSNGQGTLFDPERLLHVSPGEGRRHLLSISSRQFAQHPIWPMVNFDNGMKDKLQGLLYALSSWSKKLR